MACILLTSTVKQAEAAKVKVIAWRISAIHLLTLSTAMMKGQIVSALIPTVGSSLEIRAYTWSRGRFSRTFNMSWTGSDSHSSASTVATSSGAFTGRPVNFTRKSS